MEISLETNHSAVVTDYTKPPQWISHKISDVEQDNILIQIEASTINPSDILTIEGHVKHPKGFPFVGGKEGTGRVIKTGQKVKQFQGKRVCFFTPYGGGWSNFIILKPSFVFIIDDDVPLSTAASGAINPLTVIGFLSEIQRKNIKSIIHTAAASSLGRMLNRICQTKGITLLNIVRRQQHADLLKSQGAQHIIVTTGEWQKTFQQKIKQLNSRALFDALGGGEIQATLIKNLPSIAHVFVYGLLEANPTTSVSSAQLISGLQVHGFILSRWFVTVTKQQQKQIRQSFSHHLKKQLFSVSGKQFKLSQIAQALEEYKVNSSAGKILLKP